MDRRVQALLFSTCMDSAAHAEQPLSYEISVRQGDNEVQTVQVEISGGQVQTVDLDSGLQSN